MLQSQRGSWWTNSATTDTVDQVDVLVLSGADEYRIEQQLLRRFPAGTDREVIDFDGEGTLSAGLQAVGSMSLFGGRRSVVLRNLDRLDVESVQRLAEQLEVTQADVVITVKHRSKAANVLAKTFSITHAAKPTAKELPTIIRGIAESFDVRIDGQTAVLLAERSEASLWRVDSFFRVLSSGEVRELSIETAANLFAATGGGPSPWAVFDALESGRPAEAFALAERVDSYALCSWLSGQLRSAGLCAEHGAFTNAAAATLLGVPAWSAKRPVRWARIPDLDSVQLAVFEIELGLRSSGGPVLGGRHALAVLAAALRP